MQKARLHASILLLAVGAAACGGGGGGATDVPPPQASYSVTLLAVEIDRAADQQDMPVSGLPADGAAITVD